MTKYPDYISEKRRPITSPNSLVENGQAIFGTFDKVLSDINLLSCIKPAGNLLPHSLNKVKLTIWEVVEVMFDEGMLLAAVYNLGIAGFSLFVFFDWRTKKIKKWINITREKKAVVAPNLIDSVSELYTKKSALVFNNEFQNGRCKIKGNSLNKKSGKIEMDIEIDSISPPSIVSIPFGPNKPLYSHKEFFTVKGYLQLGDERLEAKASTTAIIDDHKGYYPFRMHYDWLTTMGKTIIDGEEKYLAFNLTRNQSTNEDDYNENILWLGGWSCPLPPVIFVKAKDKWKIKDKYDTVNLEFIPEGDFKIQIHPLIIDIDYTAPFGRIKGYVKDINGKKYDIDMNGMGEDKSTRM